MQLVSTRPGCVSSCGPKEPAELPMTLPSPWPPCPVCLTSPSLVPYFSPGLCLLLYLRCLPESLNASRHTLTLRVIPKPLSCLVCLFFEQLQDHSSNCLAMSDSLHPLWSIKQGCCEPTVGSQVIAHGCQSVKPVHFLSRNLMTQKFMSVLRSKVSEVLLWCNLSSWHSTEKPVDKSFLHFVWWARHSQLGKYCLTRN